MQQQVSGVGEDQVAVGGRGRVQRLAQALQGAAAVAFGPPEESRFIVDLPAWDRGGLRVQKYGQLQKKNINKINEWF